MELPDDIPISPARNLIAVGVGGTFAWLTSYPFDTVKARLQAMPSSGQLPPYSGPIDCLKSMIKAEGWRSLYRGAVSSPLMMSIPLTAVAFYRLTLGKRLQLTDLGQEPTLLQNMSAGMSEGFTITLATCPAERIKCMLQTQFKAKGKSNKQGPLFLIKMIYHQEGLRGFYRGVFPQLGLLMIGFGACESLKSISIPDDVTMASIVVAGLASGLALSALLVPFDVLKTKYQISPVGKYRGSRYILREILSNEGIKGLYKGYGTALVRVPIANVAFTIGYVLSLTHDQ